MIEEMFLVLSKAKDLLLNINLDETKSMNVCKGIDEQIDYYYCM